MKTSGDAVAEAVGTMIGAAIMACLVLFLVCVGGTLIGAFSGWVVGLFFHETLVSGQRAFGLTPLEPWQLGAFLGFVGGFFKSTLTSKSE